MVFRLTGDDTQIYLTKDTVREAAVLLEAAGVAVDYTYMPEETE